MMGLAWKYLSLGGLSWTKWLIREYSLVLYDSTPCKEKKRGETPLYLNLLKKRKKLEKNEKFYEKREVMILSKLLSIHEKRGVFQTFVLGVALCK